MSDHIRLVWTNPVDPADRIQSSDFGPLYDHLVIHRTRFGNRWRWYLESYTDGILAQSPRAFLNQAAAQDNFARAFDVDVWDGHNREIKWYAGDIDEEVEPGYRRVVRYIVRP